LQKVSGKKRVNGFRFLMLADTPGRAILVPDPNRLPNQGSIHSAGLCSPSGALWPALRECIQLTCSASRQPWPVWAYW